MRSIMEHHCDFSVVFLVERRCRVERPMSKPSVLWIDGVGSYALCERDSVTIGQSFPGNEVDLAIRGDLRRRACAIHRVHGEYWVEAFQKLRLGDEIVDKPVLLRDQSICVLGERVRFQYFKPSPLSSTARLNLISEHRWQPYVDAVILAAETVVIGCDPTCHIRYPMPTLALQTDRTPVQGGPVGKFLLFRKNQQWICRVVGNESVWHGAQRKGQVFEIQPGERVQTEYLSWTLEV